MIARLGWNLGLFESAAERQRQISRVWEQVEAEMGGRAPEILEEGFTRHLYGLVKRKRELFPWLQQTIHLAEIFDTKETQVVRVQADRKVEERPLNIWPDPTTLPSVIEDLRLLQINTADQAELVRGLRSIPRSIGDIAATQMTTAYGVQRAELISYHRMLSVWRQLQPGASVKQAIEYWLAVINDIDKKTEEILQTLAGPVSNPRSSSTY